MVMLVPTASTGHKVVRAKGVHAKWCEQRDAHPCASKGCAACRAEQIWMPGSRHKKHCCIHALKAVSVGATRTLDSPLQQHTTRAT